MVLIFVIPRNIYMYEFIFYYWRRMPAEVVE